MNPRDDLSLPQDNRKRFINKNTNEGLGEHGPLGALEVEAGAQE